MLKICWNLKQSFLPRQKNAPSLAADLISLSDLQSPISLWFTWLAVRFMTAGPKTASIFYSQQPVSSQTTFSGLQFKAGLLVLAMFFSSLFHTCLWPNPVMCIHTVYGLWSQTAAGGKSLLGVSVLNEKVIMPHGLTVELAGVCAQEWNTSGKTCWKVRIDTGKKTLCWIFAGQRGFWASQRIYRYFCMLCEMKHKFYFNQIYTGVLHVVEDL